MRVIEEKILFRVVSLGVPEFFFDAENLPAAASSVSSSLIIKIDFVVKSLL